MLRAVPAMIVSIAASTISTIEVNHFQFGDFFQLLLRHLANFFTIGLRLEPFFDFRRLFQQHGCWGSLRHKGERPVGINRDQLPGSRVPSWPLCSGVEGLAKFHDIHPVLAQCAGPTGGDGLACPAIICSLICAVITFFAISLLLENFSRSGIFVAGSETIPMRHLLLVERKRFLSVTLYFAYLDELQLHRRRPAEDADEYSELPLVRP